MKSASAFPLQSHEQEEGLGSVPPQLTPLQMVLISGFLESLMLPVLSSLWARPRVAVYSQNSLF